MGKGRGASGRPLVAVCGGKDCCKRPEYGDVLDALGAQCDVLETGCLGPCKGPVVGFGLDSDKPVVLTRVRKRKHRRDLLAAVLEGKALTERLLDRALGGRKRRSAVEKANRARGK